MDVHLGSALRSMHGKCGCVKDARDVFDKMSQRDIVSWNSMVAVYAQSGFSVEALEFFCEMEFAGLQQGQEIERQ